MLQKKIKLFGSLLILTGSSLILALTITSCGVVESSKPDEYSEYINDRTFSIGVNTDSESSSLGTA
ncbi:hypothetical protein FACS1894166_01810 [Bacilli bacterium]|nr:hypothetical protein FACS1894166_01810 [Bacilli bacterium]